MHLLQKLFVSNRWLIFLFCTFFFTFAFAHDGFSARSFYEKNALLIQFLCISIFVLSIFILWNRRLLNEVDRRVAVENEMESQEHQLLMAAQVAGMSGWKLDLDSNEITLSHFAIKTGVRPGFFLPKTSCRNKKTIVKQPQTDNLM